jgi:hypothetical protein
MQIVKIAAMVQIDLYVLFLTLEEAQSTLRRVCRILLMYVLCAHL